MSGCTGGCKCRRGSAVALSAAVAALAQGAAPFSAERSWQVQRIGSPVITPDGAVQRALTTNPASQLI